MTDSSPSTLLITASGDDEKENNAFSRDEQREKDARFASAERGQASPTVQVTNDEHPAIDAHGVLDLSDRGLTKLNTTHKHDYSRVVVLNVAGNRLATLDGLSAFPSLVEKRLRVLDASNNEMVACERLNLFVALRILNLSHNQIKELPVLDHLVHLTELNLAANRICNLPNLRRLSALQTLSLHGNRIALIDDAGKLLPGSLKALDLGANVIRDLTQMLNLIPLISLAHLRVAGNPCIRCETRCFDYRPYLVSCLPERLTTLDAVPISETEMLKGEWLYSQGKARHFKPNTNAHVALCEYLQRECPLLEGGTGEIFPSNCSDRTSSVNSTSLDEKKLLKVLQKRREYSENAIENAYDDHSSFSSSPRRPQHQQLPAGNYRSPLKENRRSPPARRGQAEEPPSSGTSTLRLAGDSRSSSEDEGNHYSALSPKTIVLSPNKTTRHRSHAVGSSNRKKSTPRSSKFAFASPESGTANRGPNRSTVSSHPLRPSPSSKRSSSSLTAVKRGEPGKRVTSSTQQERRGNTGARNLTSNFAARAAVNRPNIRTQPPSVARHLRQAAPLNQPRFPQEHTTNAPPVTISPLCFDRLWSPSVRDRELRTEFLPSIATPMSAVSAGRRPFSLRQEEAAIRIQSWWRGASTRRRWSARLCTHRLRRLSLENGDLRRQMADLYEQMNALNMQQMRGTRISEELTAVVQAISATMRDELTALSGRCDSLEAIAMAAMPVPVSLSFERRREREEEGEKTVAGVVRWRNETQTPQIGGYALFVDDQLCGEVRAVNRCAIVTDLDPTVEHRISIQAISAIDSRMRSPLSTALIVSMMDADDGAIAGDSRTTDDAAVFVPGGDEKAEHASAGEAIANPDKPTDEQTGQDDRMDEKSANTPCKVDG